MTEEPHLSDGGGKDAGSWWGSAAVAGWFVATAVGWFVASRLGRHDLLRTPGPAIIGYVALPYWAFVGLIALLRKGWRSSRRRSGRGADASTGNGG